MVDADFSGYATKAGLKCSDGRTITPEAFKHQDKTTVPLVWQHGHSEPSNILGHAVLEARSDGMYCEGYFNSTSQGANAKLLVQHQDIKALSIYANNLVEKAKTVLHGSIREVSLVLSGANPEALIDFVRIAHSDGMVEDLDDEAIIYTGLELEHQDQESDDPEPEEKPEPEAEPESEPEAEPDLAAVAHAASDTIQDIYNQMTDEQKNVVAYIVGSALDEAAATASHSDNTSEGDLEHTEEGTADMANVFENDGKPAVDRPHLSHDQLRTIVNDGGRLGSLRASFLEHAAEYGIEDIDFLFPDAKTLSSTPEFVSRRMEWVQNVLSETRHSPFSRIKTIQADITADEARAKGYVKGNLKKDEIIKLLKRVTTPKTIYKKQKLDRDDIVDITDLDVVSWLKAEMRLLLDEEIAAAILVGDGREPDDEDKIDEDHLRPIAFEPDMYNTVYFLDASPTSSEMIDEIVRSQAAYKGSGSPTFYTTRATLTDMVLEKDTLGRRLYPTQTELSAALGLSRIVVVEAMERVPEVVGIIVNLADYTVGADKGGEINMFDDFDIDYNQQKYLIETRISGALTKVKCAITIKRNAGTNAVPTSPTFVTSTGVVTIPTVTGVTYKNADTGVTLSPGAQTALASGDSVEIEAVASSGYSFTHGTDTGWVFTRS